MPGISKIYLTVTLCDWGPSLGHSLKTKGGETDGGVEVGSGE